MLRSILARRKKQLAKSTGFPVVIKDGKYNLAPTPVADAEFDPKTKVISNIRWYKEAHEPISYVGGSVTLAPKDTKQVHVWEGYLVMPHLNFYKLDSCKTTITIQ